MIAHLRSQFEDLSSQLKQSLEPGLLRYCELDALANLMPVQEWLKLTR